MTFQVSRAFEFHYTQNDCVCKEVIEISGRKPDQQKGYYLHRKRFVQLKYLVIISSLYNGISQRTVPPFLHSNDYRNNDYFVKLSHSHR